MEKNDDLVLSVLLEDYKARRDEINKFIDATFLVSNLSFLGIGTLLAMASFLLENNLNGIFALFSILFFALIWVQLRLTIQVIHLCDYVNHKIAPEVRSLLKQSTGRDYGFVFSWESRGRNKLHSFKLWLSPIVGARYGITLFAAISSFCVYFFSINKSGFPEPLNRIITVINILSFVYTIFVLFYVRKTLKIGK